MKIIWYGHSCFEITGNDGTVIFDPYQEGSVPGLNKLHLTVFRSYIPGSNLSSVPGK